MKTAYAEEVCRGAVCVRIPVGPLEVSIAFDNSCGAMGRMLLRNSMIIIDTRGDRDLTDECFGFAIRIEANHANIAKAIQWCREKSPL